MTHQIGILFWGCKGGHRNFCDNGVIDVYSNEIRQTYKDIRSFATFSVVNTDFYALEFTKDYKVYTHYRSSNDSGSGAFIALTIYVPHRLQVKGLRPIMDKMMDEYFSQYFNPITNSPIPGMVDDITPFQQMFEAYAVDKTFPDTSRYSKRPSVQDDTPKVLAYSSLDEVDGYFASPYHPEFFDCQEVMFISKEILQNQADYGLRFLVQPIYIEQINPPEPEPYIDIFPYSKDFRLTLFKVNGVDHTSSQGDVPLYPDDIISMRIEGNEVQRPIALDNVTLEEVVQKGLIKKIGKNYQFLPVYNLDYADFNVKAHIEGDQSATVYRCYALRSLDDPRVMVQGAQLDPRSETFVFPVSGKYLKHRFQLIYSVLPNFSVPTLIIEMKEVDVNMLIDQGHTLELSVRKHTLEFVYPVKEPPVVGFKITSADRSKSIIGTVTKPGSRMEFYLPSSFTFTPSDVELTAEGYKFRLDEKGRYEIYPEQVEVEILIPHHLENFDISALIPTYIISDKTYKGYWEQKRCYIRLPFEWVDEKGKLIISGNSFPFEELSRTKIAFKCAVVSNLTKKTLGFDVIFEDNRKVEQKLQAGRIDIYPANIDVRLAPEYQSEAIVEEKGYASDHKTKLFVLKSRDLNASTSGQGFGIDESTALDNRNQNRRLSTDEHPERHPGGQFTHPSNNRGNGQQGSASRQNQVQQNANQGDNGTVVIPNKKPLDERQDRNIQPAVPDYTIKLINCETLYARVLKDNGLYSIVPIANLDTTDYNKVNPEVRQVKLLDKREKEVCLVNFPRSAYLNDQFIADRNAKNGFEVTWVDDNRCMVNYRKNTFLGKILNSFNSNKTLYLGVISILIIALVTALWMFFLRTSEDYSLSMHFAEVKTSAAPTPINSIGYKDLLYKGDALIMSNNGDILTENPQPNPLKSPSKGGELSDLYVVYATRDTVRFAKNKEYKGTDFVVIYPEDIIITQINNDKDSKATKAEKGKTEAAKAQTPKAGSKTADAEKVWTMETLFSLLAKPSLIEQNYELSVELPPLSYLKRYQEILSMPEINEELVDSLSKDYPQYTDRIVRLKEPRATKSADEKEAVEESASEKETGTPMETPLASTTPGATTPGAVTTPKEEDKATKEAKKSTETKETIADTKTPPDDPNAAIKAEYQKKMDGLNGIFTKEMVDDIIKFRDENSKALGSEVGKYRKKLNAYYNFVNGLDFDSNQMTPEQQKAIKFAKKTNSAVYNSHNYAKIYNVYHEAGGADTTTGEDVIDN